METILNYQCQECSKYYASYKSRWLHIKKYHKTDNTNSNISCNENIVKSNNTNHKPSIDSNNIYKFKEDILGKNKYADANGGDIYIIQTDFNLQNYYKIGISTNLYKRLCDYRCGAVLEPKLHYYYPCKQIKTADKILKDKLKKYNVKREIYKTEKLEEIRNIIKNIQIEMKSDVLEVQPEIRENEIIPCKICNLTFKNKTSLIIHNNENHNENIQKNIYSGNNICKFCKKILADRKSRWKHEQKCKISNITHQNKEIENLKNIILELKDELIKQKEELIKLKNKKTL